MKVFWAWVLLIISFSGLAETKEKHLVRFYNYEQSSETLKESGAEEVIQLPQIKIKVVNVNAQKAAKLKTHKNVEYVEPEMLVAPEVIPNDPYFTSEYHLQKTQVPLTWDITKGSSNVIVAILDSGVDTNHNDLIGRFVAGWNFYDNNSNLTDVSGHGTAVAGVALAVVNNGIETAGVLWEGKLMPLRISDTNGYGSSSAITSALTWAADRGAKIANISYGVSQITSVGTAAGYFKNKGGLVFVSGGNQGTFLTNSVNNTNIIVVSATDENDVITTWSNSGPLIDITAPGQNLCTLVRGGGHGFASGTSFSSPLTAAIAGLIWSANLSLTPSQIEDILKKTSDDLGPVGYDYSYGYGRVNAHKGVQMVLGGKSPQPPKNLRLQI
jgi:thermitase